MSCSRERSYYDKAAKKQTVSVTLNADLVAQAKAEGLNLSQIAEEAIAATFIAHIKDKIRAEIKADMEACDEFISKYGSPAELARQHYAEKEEAEIPGLAEGDGDDDAV